ncbi:MAG: class I SAM-dependent methyltransferase [Deltaproteobacteria bacterium]|nr:class I SAM-dependent methyltransferase [Deltaproteobacteria bacterium]
MALSRWRDVWRRFTGRGAYPHELAFLLTIPLRRLIQPPGVLLRRLDLRRESNVLEIGPGPGYFSVAVARAVPSGRLVLYDLQREMLAKARRRLARHRAANAAFVQGDGARLPFRAGSFDVAFLVAVLGEVPDPEGCIESMRRVLRPGGLLSLTETIGDPDALTQDQARALVERKGFEVEAVFADRAGFTLNARSRSQHPG